MGGKSYCFWSEKPLKFSILARKSLRISSKTFFFYGDHLFLAVKTAKIFDFSQKKPSDFGEDLFFFRRSSNFCWKIASIQFRNDGNLGQVRLRNKLPKNPGYVLVLHEGSVNAEKTSPYAKFYNLSTGCSQGREWGSPGLPQLKSYQW